MIPMRRHLSGLRKKIGFDTLEPREKLIVAIGIGFLFVFIILQFVVSPYMEVRKKLDTSISKKVDELLELKNLQQEYRDLQEQAGGIKDRLKGRDPGFSLFTFLDEQATAAGIKELIGYMKPSTVEGEEELQESVVEMRLQSISLQQLVEFLTLVESPENVVAVKRISIQESGKDKGLLEVILQVMTFVMKGE